MHCTLYTFYTKDCFIWISFQKSLEVGGQVLYRHNLDMQSYSSCLCKTGERWFGYRPTLQHCFEKVTAIDSKHAGHKLHHNLLNWHHNWVIVWDFPCIPWIFIIIRPCMYHLKIKAKTVQNRLRQLKLYLLSNEKQGQFVQISFVGVLFSLLLWMIYLVSLSWCYLIRAAVYPEKSFCLEE